MKFVRTNKFTGDRIVWEVAVAGARAIEENGKHPGRGAPMLRIEADTFIDMQARGVNRTMSITAVYEIN